MCPNTRTYCHSNREEEEEEEEFIRIQWILTEADGKLSTEADGKLSTQDATSPRANR